MTEIKIDMSNILNTQNGGRRNGCPSGVMDNPNVCLEDLRRQFSYSADFVKFKGGFLKMWLRQSALVQTIFYTFKLDVLLHKFSRNWENSIEDAFKMFLTKEEYADEELKKELRKDINDSYWYAKTKPYEYFLFDFRGKNKDKKTRKSFITDVSMLYLLTKTGTRKLHDLELNEKGNFYKLCQPYFKRKVVDVNCHSDYDAFKDMAMTVHDIILKPVSSGCGGGIFVAHINTADEAKKTFEKVLQSGGNWIAEEFIHQAAEMASWNPTSVNSIRFTTFKNKTGIHYHLPFIRTGRDGAVVDNAGRGGIYAGIDIETGKIMTNGFDEQGNEYKTHPDSKIEYRGWQIPKWKDLIALATEMHEKIMPEHHYIGWGFALTDQGWVVIEGNWGQYVCQQSCTKKGYKEIFEKYAK